MEREQERWSFFRSIFCTFKSFLSAFLSHQLCHFLVARRFVIFERPWEVFIYTQSTIHPKGARDQDARICPMLLINVVLNSGTENWGKGNEWFKHEWKLSLLQPKDLQPLDSYRRYTSDCQLIPAISDSATVVEKRTSSEISGLRQVRCKASEYTICAKDGLSGFETSGWNVIRRVTPQLHFTFPDDLEYFASVFF